MTSQHPNGVQIDVSLMELLDSVECGDVDFKNTIEIDSR